VASSTPRRRRRRRLRRLASLTARASWRFYAGVRWLTHRNIDPSCVGPRRLQPCGGHFGAGNAVSQEVLAYRAGITTGSLARIARTRCSDCRRAGCMMSAKLTLAPDDRPLPSVRVQLHEDTIAACRAPRRIPQRGRTRVPAQHRPHSTLANPYPRTPAMAAGIAELAS
jgi:hypothetical protein